MQHVRIYVKDCGDGSSCLVFVKDKEVASEIEKLYETGAWDYETGFGVDGDGPHSDLLTFPDDFNLDGLGVSFYSRKDLDSWKKYRYEV